MKKKKYLNILRGNSISTHTFSTILSEVNTKEMLDNLNLLCTYEVFKLRLSAQIEQTEESLYNLNYKHLNAESDFKWLLFSCVFHRKKLSSFINKEKNLEKLILEEEFHKALCELSDIEKECGISLWSMSIRRTIENKLGINEAENKNEVMIYIKHYMKDKFNEPNIFIAQYKNITIEIDKAPIDENLKRYIKWKIFGSSELKEYQDLEHILRYEMRTSLIDMFKLIVEIVTYTQKCKGENKFYNIFNIKFQHVINTLKDNISYYIFNNIEYVYSKLEEKYDYDQDYLNLYNYYIKGEKSKFSEYFNQLQIEKVDLELLEIAGELNIDLENKFIGNIVKNMRNIVLKNNKYIDSYQHLKCISLSFRGIPLFQQINLFLLRETPFFSTNSETFHSWISCYSKAKTPFLFFNLNKNKAILDIKKNENKNPIEKICIYLTDINIDADSIFSYSELRTELKNLLFVKRLISDNNLIKSNKFIKDNKKNIHNEFIRVKLEQFLINSESLKNDFETVLRTAFINIEEKNSSYLYNLIFITEEIDLNFIKVSNSIYTPIFLNIYSLYIDNKHDSLLKLSLEIFLEKNNYNSILEFTEKSELSLEEQYFLRNVCKTANMKYLFDNQSELDNARLSICKYLISKNTSDQELIDEIKELNRKITLSKAKKNIETSRIYVDTSVFLGRDSHKYKDLFESYLNHCEKNIYAEDDEVLEKIYKAVKTIDYEENDFSINEVIASIYPVDLNLSAKNLTFYNLMKLMMYEFTFGEKGLNNFLSTRIRHGLLPNIIRKCAQDEYILCAEIIEDNGINELSSFAKNENEINLLNEFIRKFSKDLESKIEGLNDQKIQISILDNLIQKDNNLFNGNALFQYNVNPLEAYIVQKNLNLSPTYNDFVKIIVDWLWKRTDINLKAVRSYLKNEFKDSILKLSEDTKINIPKSFNLELTNELSNRVNRFKNSFEVNLEKISSWFERSETDNENTSYDIRIAIETAQNILSLPLKILKVDDIKISSKNLSYIVDILLILFENSISKSGFTKKDDINTEISIMQSEENIILISCKNNYRSSESTSLLNRKLDFYRESYGDESKMRKYLQQEGGSGLFKIWKIIARDLNITEHNTEFHYDNEHFMINIEMKEISL